MTDTTDTLVLGIGNLLLQDEGVGVHVVERFQQHYSVPENVRVVDGGTKGLELLTYLEDAQRMLIVDAIDSGQPPGSILRLTDDEIPSVLKHKLSPHHVGLADLLAAARLRDRLPGEIVLIGVEPFSLDVGMELSPGMSARMPELLQAVCTALQQWGITATPR